MAFGDTARHLLLFPWAVLSLTPQREVQSRTHAGPQLFSFNSRRDALVHGVTAAAILAGQPVGAAGPRAAMSSAFRFVGEYADELHPMCERKVAVREEVADPESKKKVSRFVATFTGTDIGPVGIGDKIFLPCDEQAKARYPLRTFQFEALISADGEGVDAEDGVHQGRLNSVQRGDEFDGIRWKDGNRWVRKAEKTTAAAGATTTATTKSTER